MSKASNTGMHLKDWQILNIASSNIDNFICIDTETTGLNPEKDEVLSLAIVDQDGNTLFNHYIKPSRRKRWPSATEIHGIRWADVKNEKELWEYEKELTAIFSSAPLVVGYNLQFDLNMLAASGAKLTINKEFDLMKQFAAAYGEWMEWKNGYKWMKLVECAERYDYEFEAHDALNDAKATAYCYKKFVEECRYAKDAKRGGLWGSGKKSVAKSGQSKPKNAVVTAIIAIFAVYFLLSGIGDALGGNPIALLWGFIVAAALGAWALSRMAK